MADWAQGTRRRALRGQLRWLGYAPLYDGLWVSPHAPGPKASAELAAVSLGAMTVFRARHLDVGAIAGRDPIAAWDVAAIAGMWRHGSVVRSWLLDLTAEFLQDDAALDAVAPVVSDSGEGRWTAVEAIEQGVPAPVLSLALMMRLSSQGKGDYGDKLLAMMRKGFGGHKITSGD
jgi:6-phosphogluconate dehydrogenase (decarboxylating)